MRTLDELLKDFFLPQPSRNATLIGHVGGPLDPGEGASIRGEFAEPEAPTFRPPAEPYIVLPNIDADKPAEPEVLSGLEILSALLDEVRAIKPGGDSNAFYERNIPIAAAASTVDDFVPNPCQYLYIPRYVRASGTVSITLNSRLMGVFDVNTRIKIQTPFDWQDIQFSFATGADGTLRVYYSTHPFDVSVSTTT